MNLTFLIYAKKLDEIGDKINEISNSIPIISEVNKYTEQDLIIFKDKFSLSIERYYSTVNTLTTLSAPEIVKDEHRNLIEGIQSFIRGSKLMEQSINIQDNVLDIQKLQQGKAIQDIGVGIVKDATNSIINKLEATMKNN